MKKSHKDLNHINFNRFLGRRRIFINCGADPSDMDFMIDGLEFTMDQSKDKIHSVTFRDREQKRQERLEELLKSFRK